MCLAYGIGRCLWDIICAPHSMDAACTAENVPQASAIAKSLTMVCPGVLRRVSAATCQGTCPPAIDSHKMLCHAVVQRLLHFELDLNTEYTK